MLQSARWTKACKKKGLPVKLRCKCSVHHGWHSGRFTASSFSICCVCARCVVKNKCVEGSHETAGTEGSEARNPLGQVDVWAGFYQGRSARIFALQFASQIEEKSVKAWGPKCCLLSMSGFPASIFPLNPQQQGLTNPRPAFLLSILLGAFFTSANGNPCCEGSNGNSPGNREHIDIFHFLC